jgi:hypothetical protein
LPKKPLLSRILYSKLACSSSAVACILVEELPKRGFTNVEDRQTKESLSNPRELLVASSPEV